MDCCCRLTIFDHHMVAHRMRLLQSWNRMECFVPMFHEYSMTVVSGSTIKQVPPNPLDAAQYMLECSPNITPFTPTPGLLPASLAYLSQLVEHLHNNEWDRVEKFIHCLPALANPHQARSHSMRQLQTVLLRRLRGVLEELDNFLYPDPFRLANNENYNHARRDEALAGYGRHGEGLTSIRGIWAWCQYQKWRALLFPGLATNNLWIRPCTTQKKCVLVQLWCNYGYPSYEDYDRQVPSVWLHPIATIH